MRARQLSVRRQVGKGEHRCKYIRQEFLQLQSFLIKVVEWRQNPARPWGQAGSIDYVYLKKKKIFQSKAGQKLHWHARLTSQGAAALAGPKDEDQVFGGPGAKPQKQQVLGTRGLRSPAQSISALRGERKLPSSVQCLDEHYTSAIESVVKFQHEYELYNKTWER